jgi:hypothetical protein
MLMIARMSLAVNLTLQLLLSLMKMLITKMIKNMTLKPRNLMLLKRCFYKTHNFIRRESKLIS